MLKLQLSLMVIIVLLNMTGVQYVTGLSLPAQAWRQLRFKEDSNARAKRNIFDDIFDEWFGPDDKEQDDDNYLICKNCTVFVQQGNQEAMEAPTKRSPTTNAATPTTATASSMPDVAGDE